MEGTVAAPKATEGRARVKGGGITKPPRGGQQRKDAIQALIAAGRLPSYAGRRENYGETYETIVREALGGRDEILKGLAELRSTLAEAARKMVERERKVAETLAARRIRRAELRGDAAQSTHGNDTVNDTKGQLHDVTTETEAGDETEVHGGDNNIQQLDDSPGTGAQALSSNIY